MTSATLLKRRFGPLGLSEPAKPIAPHGRWMGTRRKEKSPMSGTATNETRDLIASDKVEGTSVYNQAGEKLGSVHNLMVDKRSERLLTRSCPSAASSVWVRAITPFRAKSLLMSRHRAAMSSSSLGSNLRERRPTPPAYGRKLMITTLLCPVARSRSH
jgi:hypothetical protein